jgi:hypothetical protein
MSSNPLCALRRLSAAMAAATAVLLVSACAGGGATAPDGASSASGTARGGSVEVFGVIDAGVSHSTSKSDRR